MSNTTPTSPRGTDASHFTVEDTGSTTDAADLFHNDTTATGSTIDTGSANAPDEVAAASGASGPGTQADRASSTSDAGGAVRSSGSHAAVPVTKSHSGPSVDATAPVTHDRDATPDRDATRDSHATPDRDATHDRDARPPVDDDSIGHVFDQTNGVVEGIHGDSNGFAEDGSQA